MLACEVRTVGEMASGGKGSRISTDVAVLRSLNCDRALTRYSVRLRLCFSTWHSTQISGLMFWLSRYVLHRCIQQHGKSGDQSAAGHTLGRHRQVAGGKWQGQERQAATTDNVLPTSHMRSKAPSGGMKEMVRSRSKDARRTHWWNFMSSRSTAF